MPYWRLKSSKIHLAITTDAVLFSPYWSSNSCPRMRWDKPNLALCGPCQITFHCKAAFWNLRESRCIMYRAARTRLFSRDTLHSRWSIHQSVIWLPCNAGGDNGTRLINHKYDYENLITWRKQSCENRTQASRPRTYVHTYVRKKIYCLRRNERLPVIFHQLSVILRYIFLRHTSRV